MIKQTIHFVEKIEDYLLVSLLLVMIGIAVLQIFLRNMFDAGLLWGDPLVRVLVLWIGLIGAMIASRNNHHISIDVLSRYLPEKIAWISNTVVFIFTAAICGMMAWFSLDFMIMEKQDKMMAFNGVPAWICESIIPFAFFVICVRYILLTLGNFKQPFRNRTK